MSVSEDAILPSASEQWQAVLEGAATSQEEIPPQIVAAKTADVRHSQVLRDEAATAEAHHHHSDWSTVQGKHSSYGAKGKPLHAHLKEPEWLMKAH